MSDIDDELEFSVKAYDGAHTVRVSPIDDGVWLGLSMTGCNAYTTITKAQAQELIDALTAVIKG
jgi:hypothetical protein